MNIVSQLEKPFLGLAKSRGKSLCSSVLYLLFTLLSHEEERNLLSMLGEISIFIQLQREGHIISTSSCMYNEGSSETFNYLIISVTRTNANVV